MSKRKQNEVAAKEIMTDFLISYAEKPKSVTDKSWLEEKFLKHLPKIPRDKVKIFVEELFQNSCKLNQVTEEILKSAEYECSAEIWMYKKILLQAEGADENFGEEIFAWNRILEDVNFWLADILDELRQLKFDEYDRFYFDEDEFEKVGNRKIFPATKKVAKSEKTFLTKDAVGANLQKALSNQLQRTLKTDLGHVNVQSHDIDVLAASLGKNAALNGVGGMAVTTMLTIMMQGGLKGKGSAEVLKLLMQSGTTQGIKTATAGALKVVAERGFLPVLNRATPLTVIVALSSIVTESFKILVQRNKGKINSLEAADKIARVTTAAIFSVGFATAGRLAGIAAFSVIPVAGPVVGGIVGSLLGELTGSLVGGKVGDLSYTKAKQIFTVFSDIVKVDQKIIVARKMKAFADLKIYSQVKNERLQNF